MSRPVVENRPSLAAILDGAGVTRSSVIRVAGPGGLPALLWLCAQGFASVGHVRSLRGPALDGCDALIIARPCDAFELKRTLHLARRLRAGAVLVAPLHADLRGAGAAVARLLAEAGFVADGAPQDGRGAVVVARRRGAMKKAA